MLFCADHRFPMQKYVHKSKNILKLEKICIQFSFASSKSPFIVDLKSDESDKENKLTPA